MAHWIITDHGFGGQDYVCSDCHEVFNDLFFAMPSDNCPKCWATINEDENECYDEMTRNTPEVHLLTNKEAANVIKNLIKGYTPARGSAKSMMQSRVIEALCKAVRVLENTPDEDDN